MFGALTAKNSWADSKSTPSVRYDAPIECPSVDALSEAMQARVRDVKSGAVEWRALVVHIERDKDGFHGSLSVPESSDGTLQRKVHSARCDDVVQALALIGAVLAGPRPPGRPPEDTNPNDVPASPPSNGISPSNPPIGSGPIGASLPPSALPTHADGAMPGHREPNQRTTSRETRWGLQGMLAVGGAIQTGPAPDPLIAPRFAVGAALVLGSAGHAVDVWLSVARASSPDLRRTIGDARLTWQAVRLDACVRLPVSLRFSFDPCVSYEMGSVSGRGQRASQPNTSEAPWSAVGASMRVQGRIIGPMFLYLDVSVALPIARAHFYFARRHPADGIEDIHQVPWIALGGGAGAGVWFP